MVVIYGWTYADFNTALGWDRGVEATYLLWENFWARKVDSYIFLTPGLTPRLTDANEKLEVSDIINEMMVQMNIYLKGESVESPLETGFYSEALGFPKFKGDPSANDGKGTDHYLTLNKLKRKYSILKVASFRIGIIPSNNPFHQDRLIR